MKNNNEMTKSYMGNYYCSIIRFPYLAEAVVLLMGALMTYGVINNYMKQDSMRMDLFPFNLFLLIASAFIVYIIMIIKYPRHKDFNFSGSNSAAVRITDIFPTSENETIRKRSALLVRCSCVLSFVFLVYSIVTGLVSHFLAIQMNRNISFMFTSFVLVISAFSIDIHDLGIKTEKLVFSVKNIPFVVMFVIVLIKDLDMFSENKQFLTISCFVSCICIALYSCFIYKEIIKEIDIHSYSRSGEIIPCSSENK